MNEQADFRRRLGTAAGSIADKPYPVATQPINSYDSGPKDFLAARRWAKGDNVVWGAPSTVDMLSPGVYATAWSPERGPMLLEKAIVTDGLIELPDPASHVVLREFEVFWGRRQRFKDHGFLHKRGYLLWGPPGSGKTSALQLMMRHLVIAGGVVVLVDVPSIAVLCLALLRQIEPERPAIVVLEDIDAIIMRYGEPDLLSLLDGESQIDGVVYLATTNYPERLDARLVDRPSRFDTITYFGMPSALARATYFKAKDKVLAVDDDELAKWVRLSRGFSVAHLKEMLVAVRCLDQSLEDVVERLESMHERKPTSEDSPDRMPLGFSHGLNGGGHA